MSLAYETTRKNELHLDKGWDDLYLVFFLVNVVTVARFLYKTFVLEPITRRLGMKPGLTSKFVEAGWFGFYYVLATYWGYVIFNDDVWWFSTRHLWDGYPHNVDHDMKLYYLSSLAFWLQSLLSFAFEPPRKDDAAMAFHHCLTVSLIVTSYLAGMTRVGAAILMQQNSADIVYYHSKLFKYAKLELVSTIGWVSFLFVWFYTRHVVFGAILYSLWSEVQLYIPYAWDPANDHYWTFNVHAGFFTGLMLLQFLMIFWFMMILKVAYRVLSGQGEIKDTTEYEDEEVAPKSKSTTTVTTTTVTTKSEPEPQVVEMVDDYVILANGMKMQRKKSA